MKNKAIKTENQAKKDAWEKAGEITGDVILKVLTMLSMIVVIPYLIFVRLPVERSMFLGVFRAVAMVVIISVIETYKHDMVAFGIPQGILTIFGALCAVNFIASLMVWHGLHLNEGYSAGTDTSEFGNIDEALRFREGVVNMQSTNGKIDEYAKTAFFNPATFGNSSNMTEALNFLNGKLAMQSTSGKYEMLKRTFGGK